MYEVRPDTWNAVDLLGRRLPTNLEAGSPRADRFVGLFYWTWHNYPHGPSFANYLKARNNTVTNEISPDARNDYEHPAWEGCVFGHWNEPIYGFYKSFDRWVLRKHAELLADALVDVVIFDCTNGTDSFDYSYQTLAEVFSEARRDGVKCPQIAFLLPLHMGDPVHNNENCRVQLRNIYENFYGKGKNQDVWFYWKGKPLVMAYPDGLNPDDPLEKEILDFFTFRPCQPGYMAGQVRPDMWGWLSVTPQAIYRNPDGTPEQVCVGVAQNHNEKRHLTAMSGENVFGRTYTTQGFDPAPDAVLRGPNFQEQWDYALRVDPEFIFVTGWNEGLACRTPEWCGVKNAWWDQFNDENSRDCEPSKGKLKDCYYYQLCANIRRFKGVRPQMAPRAKSDVGLDSPRADWDALPVYGSYPHNIGPRDEMGYGIQYTNDTGRNDLVAARASHDDEFVYIEAECAKPITDKTDPRWMRLFIRTRLDLPSWEGFHFAVNRINPSEKAVLERSLGGWKWKLESLVDYRLDGDRLTVKIPRARLGLDTPDFKLWFKWTDNTQDADIMSVYTDGDSAPGGRFMYYYNGRDE